MHGFGFSLKRLLAVVTFAAVGLTALLNASEVWESVVGLMTAIFLLTALVAVICSRSQRRAFWIGCAVFAAGYLFIADNPLRDDVRHPTLLTHIAIDSLHEALNSDLATVWARERARSPVGLSRSKRDTIRIGYQRTRSSFRRTAQYLFAWVFAMLGGFVGSYFYARRERDSHNL